MSQLRDTIGHILTHEIIYSRQYESIEYGKAGDRLETLLASEMGKFAEWASVDNWLYIPHLKEWANLRQGNFSTPQLIELYNNRDKV